MDDPATVFQLKKQAITKKVADYFKTHNEGSAKAKDLKKIINEAQKVEKIQQWVFLPVAKSIYFPTESVSDETIDEILENPAIPREEFVDDVALLSYLRHDYLNLEVLLSTDGISNLYAKHLKNLEKMASASEKKTIELTNRKRSREKTFLGAKERQAQAERGELNPESHKSIKETTGEEYTQKCLVSNNNKNSPPKKKKIYFLGGAFLRGKFCKFFFFFLSYPYITFLKNYYIAGKSLGG